MPFLSDALARIGPSPTIVISDAARRLRAAGRDVIALSAGEPDFDTPANVRAAAKAAIDRGETRYTAPEGIPELRRAVADKFRRDNGIDCTPERTMVSTGGKQVIFNALLATVNPGDEVVVPAPYWVSYPDIVRLAGGAPRIVATAPEDGFRLRPAALEAALSPRTKWVILNSPGNPTGAGYAAADLRALAEVLLAHPHVWVLSDDIYEQIAYPPFEFATLAGIEPRLAGRCLTVNGVSKSHAMTGWRIGYCCGPEPLIRAMTTLQGQSTTNPCSISQWAALEALAGPQEHLPMARATFRRRRDTVLARLRAIPGVTCTEPEGAFYLFPAIADLLGGRGPDGRQMDDAPAFSAALLDAEGVALVPGDAFGRAGHVRLSYAASDPTLAEACTRIARFCRAMRAG